MHKIKLTTAAITFTIASLFAFKKVDTGSIKGTVTPAASAIRAWALSPTDTFKTTISNGSFELTNLKPNTYRVIIEAATTYKSATKDDVSVKDGQATDVGEIKLDSATLK